MKRIGNLFLLLLLVALPASAAETEFRQELDAQETGLADPFQVTVSVSNAPDGASLDFPASKDLELLGRSESSQSSFQLINGHASVKHTRSYTLTLRANRLGLVKIPPSVLRLPNGQVLKTEPLSLTVRKGHVAQPRPSPQDPFAAFGFPSMRPPLPSPPQAGQQPVDVDSDDDFPSDVQIPRTDSDLFLRASVDRTEVYVSQQVTLSLYLFSRVDLAQVDPVGMPKLDGFWSEDIDSPQSLSAEARNVGGVPYRAYLLRKRALFPVKAGSYTIEPAEVDVTTGFFFAGRRVHRVANPLTIKVKPLPPNPPAGFVSSSVGQLKLSVTPAQKEVELGNPITVRVAVEGEGNVRGMTPPKLVVPPSFHVYDPTTTDKSGATKNRVGGRRVQEYLVLPQEAGTFTVPAMAFPYFDPEAQRYQVSRSEPFTLTVKPGAGGVTSLSTAAASGAAQGAKNLLDSSGLHPLRFQAAFVKAPPALWREPYFLPLLITPPAAWLSLGLLGLARGRLRREDARTLARKKSRAAMERLAGAETLRNSPDAAAFYAEVERALLSFLEAKLKVPVLGLTQEALDARLKASGVPEADRSHVQAALNLCAVGRFSPGAEQSGRQQALERAQAVMDNWGKEAGS